VVVSTAADWFAWAALLLPLAVLAWSGIGYVKIQSTLGRQREFDNFFQTLERIQNSQGSAIQQRAAVFELRNYPQYKELVLRLCDQAEGTFSGKNDLNYHFGKLMEEFKLTAQHLKNHHD
jgi:hypothetical protein